MASSALWKLYVTVALSKLFKKTPNKIGMRHTNFKEKVKKKGTIEPTLCQRWMMTIMPWKRGYKPYWNKNLLNKESRRFQGDEVVLTYVVIHSHMKRFSPSGGCIVTAVKYYVCIGIPIIYVVCHRKHESEIMPWGL